MISELGWAILKIQIRYELDVVAARQKTRRIAELLGFDSQDQVRLSTAVSEIGRNCFQYAKAGTVDFFLDDKTPKQSLLIRIRDKGPGIAAIEEIKAGKYKSKTGMGVGLMGSKKLMDHFSIETSFGQGTTVVLGKLFAADQPHFDKTELPGLIGRLISGPNASPIEEMQNQNRELLDALDRLKTKETEMMILYAQLDEKAKSLQRANEVKTSFLSNMSHEIRTPLGVVVGFAQLALKSGLSHEVRRKYLETVIKNAQGLTKLIGDILDLAKVESGKMDFEKAEFSPIELAEDIVAGLRLQLGRKAIPLHLSFTDLFPVSIIGDTTRVRQVMTNMLSNALKFTEHGSVTLELSCERGGTTSNIKIIILVKDTGIGIADLAQDRLFETFMQADSSTTRKYGGTGLGLNLSREIAVGMGGNLSLDVSIIGAGSTFRFEFLAQEVSLSKTFEKNPQVDESRDSKDRLIGRRVLLVEDSEDNTFLINQLLKPTGAIISTAADGREGVDMAVIEKYDVILMDVQMPRLDGYAATTELREKGIQTPIIALTANALKGDKDLALNSGFNAYVTKPVDIPTLIRTIEELTTRETERVH